MSRTYFDFQATVKVPSLEVKVADDLRKALDVTKEVIDRLAGKDGDVVQEILNGYADFVREEQTDRIVNHIAEMVGAQFLEAIKGPIKKLLLPYRFGNLTAVRLPTFKKETKDA